MVYRTTAIRIATLSFALAATGCNHSDSSTDTNVATTAAPAQHTASAVPSATGGLSDAEKEALSLQIVQRKVGAVIYVTTGTPDNPKAVTHRCSDFVGYNEPEIVDSHIDGSSGRIIVHTVTQLMKPFDASASMMSPQVKCDLAPNQQVGKLVPVEDEFRITKWESGWKLDS